MYGSGSLAMSLGLNNFDSIVLLEQFNNGYPMSIPDMAAIFYVVDETKPGDGSDKMATITCHNSLGPVPNGRAGELDQHMNGDDPKWCDNPVFAINRSVLRLG